MDELAKKRADKMGDSRLWSAADALEDLLSDVRSGKVNPTQLAIHYFEGTPETGLEHHYAVSGLTYPNHIALLTIALQRMVGEWKK